MSTTETKAEEKTAEEVSITVNHKPVDVPKHTTGAEIKRRAGVSETFQLFRITGKKEHPVADDDELTVHDGERFVASPSLDPS